MKVYKKRVYKKKTGPKKSTAPSKRMVKTIQSVIKKDAETKFVSIYNNNQTLNFYTTATSIPTFLITPTVQQGTNDGTRIGNQIQTTKVIFRYKLSAPITGTAPIRYVRVLIVKEKAFPVRNPSTNINTDLFRAGSNGATVGPQNNDLDQLLKINSESWVTIYDKQHKIGSSGNPAALGSNNNDFPQSNIVSVNLQRHFGKIQYADTVATPITKNFWVMCICSPADGSTATSGADSGIKLTYDCQMSYKDI